MGLGPGHFPGDGGRLEAAEGKSRAKLGAGGCDCPGLAGGLSQVGEAQANLWGCQGMGLASLTQPLSPEQPAIHNLALQAGGVCLQPVPEQ